MSKVPYTCQPGPWRGLYPRYPHPSANTDNVTVRRIRTSPYFTVTRHYVMMMMMILMTLYNTLAW